MQCTKLLDFTSATESEISCSKTGLNGLNGVNGVE